MSGYVLKRSNRKGKKFMILHGDTAVHFGQAGASDYTKHKDYDRMIKYLKRHAGNMSSLGAKNVTSSRREKWGKEGVGTAGFWSRWLLWNLPTLEESIKDTERRFKIKIDKL